MVTTSIDKTVRVWDVENQASKFVYDKVEQQASCIKWSPDGKLLALNERKGKLSVIDIRTENEALSTISHPGPKAQSNIWCSDTTIMSVGFNSEAKRKYCIWDVRNMGEPLVREDLGNGNSVQRLFYDREHDLVFSTGRGSMEICLWKYAPTEPKHLKFLCDWKSPQPTIGFSLMPKHVVNVKRHEVQRAVRLLNDKTWHYCSITSENKTGLFQP